MARTARASQGEILYHVLNRGNGRVYGKVECPLFLEAGGEPDRYPAEEGGLRLHGVRLATPIRIARNPGACGACAGRACRACLFNHHPVDMSECSEATGVARLVEGPLAERILAGEFAAGDQVRIEAAAGELRFTRG